MATCAADALMTVTASLSLERLLLEAGRSSVSSFLLQAQQTTQASSFMLLSEWFAQRMLKNYRPFR